MTLAEMRAEVRLRIDESSTTFFSDAHINGWLNQGQLDVAKRLPPEALHTLREEATTPSVNGQSSYALPSDFLQWRGVAYGGKPCRMIDLERLRAIQGDNVYWTPTMSEPMAFVWKTMNVFPVPDSDGIDIVLYYVRQPREMVLDTDECELSVNLHEAVLLYAVAQAYFRDRDFEAAQAALALYKDQLAIYGGQ